MRVVSALSKPKGGVLGMLGFLAYLYVIYNVIVYFLRGFGYMSPPFGTVDVGNILGFSMVVAVYMPTYTLFLIRRLKRAQTTAVP